MSTAVTTIEGENLPHRVLWLCALKQLEVAKAVSPGHKYFHLTAMLMAYLTYEAYLNFAGSRVAPADWKNERAFFAKPGYWGAKGKLKRLLEVAGLPPVDESSDQYKTILSLKVLRDHASHAKPERYVVRTEHPVTAEAEFFGPNLLGDAVSPELAAQAIEHVGHFLEQLHTSLRPSVKDIWFGDSALKGVTGYAVGKTKVNA